MEAMLAGKLLELLRNSAQMLVRTHNVLARHLTKTGNPLELLLPLTVWKQTAIPRVMTSGMVITQWIGQSAGKVPKRRFGKTHGTPSTTARVSVAFDELTTQKLLEIQSSPESLELSINTPKGAVLAMPTNWHSHILSIIFAAFFGIQSYLHIFIKELLHVIPPHELWLFYPFVFIFSKQGSIFVCLILTRRTTAMKRTRRSPPETSRKLPKLDDSPYKEVWIKIIEFVRYNEFRRFALRSRLHVELMQAFNELTLAHEEEDFVPSKPISMTWFDTDPFDYEVIPIDMSISRLSQFNVPNKYTDESKQYQCELEWIDHGDGCHVLYWVLDGKIKWMVYDAQDRGIGRYNTLHDWKERYKDRGTTPLFEHIRHIARAEAPRHVTESELEQAQAEVESLIPKN